VQEQTKLETLKVKYKLMQEEETKAIENMQNELVRLRKDHE